MANFIHKTSINLVVLGSGYIVVSTLVDYNETYKESRQKEHKVKLSE